MTHSFFPRPFLALLAVAGIALSGCGSSFQHPAAVVNGVRITDDELRSGIPRTRVLAVLTQQPPPCGTAVPGEGTRSTCVRATLDLLIRLLVVRPYAERHRIAVTSAELNQTVDAIRSQLGATGVARLLQQNGLRAPDLARLVREQVYLGKVRQSVASDAVTDQQVRAAYEQHRADFTQLHLAHISVATKALADRVVALAATTSFAKLAKRYSTDQASAEKGGDVGTIPAGRLPPTLVQAALAAPVGGIAGPVRISSSDWEIIRVISVSVTPLDEARGQIVSQLAGPAFENFLLRRYRAADVQVNPRYGRFDAANGEVEPINSTSTALPSPSPSPS